MERSIANERMSTTIRALASDKRSDHDEPAMGGEVTDRRADGVIRVRRAQAAMARSGLDVLLLATGPNLVYLSGYPSIERTLARPFYLLLPTAGDPILVVHEGRAHEARRYGWVGDVRTYERLSIAPVEVITSGLRDLGIGAGRIGVELGFEQRLGMPVAELERVRDAVRPAELVDAADLLWGLRRVKSSFEIEAMRRACEITAGAYASVFATLRAGLRERDVALGLKEAMLRSGGDDPWVAITSGAGNYDLATGVGSERILEPGDMVWADSGCSVDGYWSDFGRGAVIGRASQDQRALQAKVHDITMTGVELARPGMSTGEIARIVNGRMAELGVATTSSISDLAGRIGHGVGLDITEPPHVTESDRTILEPGMVITIEPGVATEYGIFHIEEQVLVTEGAPVVLSRSPRDLIEVDA
jgi:Xaa-Pro dipeptidase